MPEGLVLAFGSKEIHLGHAEVGWEVRSITRLLRRLSV